MNKKLVPLAAVAAFSISLAAAPAQAAIIFGIDNNNQLVSFDSANPSTYLSTVAVTGLNGDLLAIDFRPLTNALFGYTSNASLVTIDLVTGAATQIGSPDPVAGTFVGFDFNSQIDRIRLVTNADTNSVLVPDTGARSTATNLAFAAGDPNSGVNPDVTAAAYNTARPLGTSPASPGGPNQLFVIDTGLDILARQNNNGGILTTVGALSFDLSGRTSFDIDINDIGFVQNGQNLFSVNLGTGALTSLGQTQTALFGISAFRANANAVPEPGTWAMMLIGFGAMGVSMRRRRKAKELPQAA